MYNLKDLSEFNSNPSNYEVLVGQVIDGQRVKQGTLESHMEYKVALSDNNYIICEDLHISGLYYDCDLRVGLPVNVYRKKSAKKPFYVVFTVSGKFIGGYRLSA